MDGEHERQRGCETGQEGRADAWARQEAAHWKCSGEDIGRCYKG